jgi:hypothetical protein
MNLGQWVYAVEHAVAGAIPVARCLKAGGDLITEHELEERVLQRVQRGASRLSNDTTHLVMRTQAGCKEKE